jgi:tRNA A-37 threonylcarbamoyl transferase component Bud32
LASQTELSSIGVAAVPDGRFLDVGARLALRYLVHGVLGRGGNATVYLARDEVLGQEVALKVLHVDRLERRGYQRLLREARVARRARGRHLARIHDVVEHDGLVFLVMEHCPGGSLADRLHEDGELEIERVLELAEQALEGLDELHRLGIVHRDLKPANLLLDDEGRIRIADFGLARSWNRAETRLTEGIAVVGTVEYVSPEQARGQELDGRSDLYSFGIVLFEMLAGRLPYEGTSPTGLLLAHVGHRPPGLRRFRSSVPRWLDRFVARLLEKRPADRYHSAAEALTALRRRRSGWVPRLRRRLAAAAVGLMALSFVSLTLWSALAERNGFDHLGEAPGGGVAAYDGRGQLLWADGHPRATYAVGKLEPRGERRVVGFDGVTSDLRVVDPRSGRLLRRIQMPSMGEKFPGFAERFGPEIFLFDLDGDGGDEVLVSYHHLYWPSYTVLWEPRVARTRIVLVASGHHRPVASVDIDGDRRAELVFGGFANRMGHAMALAAVTLEPPANRPGSRSRMVMTPDRQGGPWGELRWYALLPQDTCRPGPGCLAVDEASRSFLLGSPGSALVVGFDGFLRDAPGSSPSASIAPPQRAAAREEAYRRTAEAQRLLDAGDPGQAVAETELAARAARRAADPMLLEWAERLRGQALALSHRTAEAQAHFASLVAQATSPTDVAYDAARAFHLAGDLPRAVDWYRRGFGRDRVRGRGRGREELIEGLVLALGELGRWQEAQEATLRYSTGESVRTSVCAAWVAWRRGRAIAPTGAGDGSPDFDHYLDLEIRHAAGADGEPFLADIRRARQASSTTKPLLRSLEAEVLAGLGRTRESADLARRAWEETRVERARSVVIRGHADLVRARFERLAAG